jgi:hypothetical protein
MMTPQDQGTAYADLFMGELRWKGDREMVMTRAQLYINAGLPLEQVLEAMKLSRSAWYKRVAVMEAARAERAAADERRRDEGQASESAAAG